MMSEHSAHGSEQSSTALQKPPVKVWASLGNLMTLRFGPRARLTDKLFAAIAAENDELRLERTATGDLEIMSPAASGASNKNFLLSIRFGRWTENEGRGLGVGFDSSAGFTLPNGAIRSPDASWIAQERWETVTSEPASAFLHICPDFVVELRSSSDRIRKLREKMREYMTQGARLGWLIDPLTGNVEIYRPGQPVERLLRPAKLSGEEVLPGFVLELKGIVEG